jgi:RimJ/RimL family protein N-acetyltransferase/mannose-6-phosphate isomerase-like protein (cupin superfamily)
VPTPRLETERLILRAWRSSDVAPFAAMSADPEVMRWIGSGRTRSRAESEAAVAVMQAAWHERGFGLFALETREHRRFCGFCGLSVPDVPPEVMPAVEIGWRLSRGFWGAGLASEAAASVLSFAFEALALPRLVAINQNGNLASHRIMEKLGMRLWLSTMDPSCGRRVSVCELSRTVWLKQRPGYLQADEGSEYFFEEGCFILELLNDPTDPAISTARARVPSGTTTRWHRLRATTERYVILEGRGQVEIGDDSPRSVVAGDVVRIPPMTRQRISNTGEQDLIFLAICSPRFQKRNYLPV